MRYNDDFKLSSEGGNGPDVSELLTKFERFWDLNGIALSEHPELWTDEDDSVFFNSNGTVSRSVDEWLAGFREYEPNLSVVEEPSVSAIHITIGGDLAVVTSPEVTRRFEWRKGLEKQQPSHSSSVRATVIYRRLAGQWKAFHAHFSYTSEGERPWAADSESADNWSPEAR